MADGGKWADFFFFLAALMPKIFVTTVLGFFIQLADTVSKQLRTIHRDLINIYSSCAYLNHHYQYNSEKMIKILRCQHIFVCQTVEKLNQYFGFILFVEICHTLINFSVYAIYFYFGSAYKEDWRMIVWSFALAIDQIVHLTLITVMSDRIRNEVRKVQRIVFKARWPLSSNKHAYILEQKCIICTCGTRIKSVHRSPITSL